ncbi:MAG TPA: ion channel [Flavobacterium sp.]|mgnify:CR=1 FL=1|nr:ion channel [Flavobacterium sp.]
MKSFKSTWDESKIFPFFLTFLIIFLFLILPFSHNRPFIQGLVSLFLAINLVLGIYSIKTKSTIRYLAIIFAIIVSTLEILNVNLEDSNIMFVAIIGWIVIISLLLYVFIIKVFESHSNSFHRIQGGIACYLLIGLLFAFIYYLIYNLVPDSFNYNDSFSGSEIVFYNFIYYSYITLCTVGFGDITPIVTISQSTSIFEAIIGVLFPTVLIGYLISDATSKK